MTARPLNSIMPAVGVSSPLISFSSVDLPQPDGPITDRKLRRSIAHDRLSNTVSERPLALKILPTPRTSMIGSSTTERGCSDSASESMGLGRALTTIMASHRHAAGDRPHHNRESVEALRNSTVAAFAIWPSAKRPPPNPANDNRRYRCPDIIGSPKAPDPMRHPTARPTVS